MTENKPQPGIAIIDKLNENADLREAKGVEELDLRKAMELLQETIKDWRSEVSFASIKFAGHTKENQTSLTAAVTSMNEGVGNLGNILQALTQSSTKIEEQTMILALLPTKVHQTLKELIPEIGKEVEKIHSERMEKITTDIKQTGQELKDNIWQSQKLIEDTTEESIRKIEEIQFVTLESNKKQMAEFGRFVKTEVEAITSNHGEKFLRNLVITLVLATISGGITSWSVGTYFP